MLRLVAGALAAVAIVALVHVADRLPMRAWWGLMLGVAATLRFGWAVLAPGTPTSDALYFVESGAQLAAGHGYLMDGQPTGYWPVGYPFALSLAFRVLGPSAATARALNVVLSVAAVALAWYVGHAIAGDRVGRAAALTMAIWPGQIWAVAPAWSDLLAQVLVLAALAAGFHRRRELAAIAGVLVGVGMLTRPAASIAVPTLVVVWILRGEAWIARSAILALVSSSSPAPGSFATTS